MVTTIINDSEMVYYDNTVNWKMNMVNSSHWIFTNTKQIILKGIFQDFHFDTIWLILIACRTMHPRLFKVAATSLKFGIRLHAHPVARTHDTKAIFTSIWLAHVFGTRLLCTWSYFRLRWWCSNFKPETLSTNAFSCI